MNMRCAGDVLVIDSLGVGEEHYFEAAMCFFRAQKVYPSPVELIMIYQKTVPAPVYLLVVGMMSLEVSVQPTVVQPRANYPVSHPLRPRSTKNVKMVSTRPSLLRICTSRLKISLKVSMAKERLSCVRGWWLLK